VNPSTALAVVVVDELVRNGVREAVLSPGSRSAPLALALHAADAQRRLRLHVRIDERTAGFLALGLAKASGTPVPVVTTSGTAAVNLHPAVVEAAYAGVPLVAITADRPAELRCVGANQTIDQERLFGRAVVSYADIPAPDASSGQLPGWRRAVATALLDARRGGPVQLNISFRDPLLPDGTQTWPEPLDGDPHPGDGDQPAGDGPPVTLLDPGPRTVVVAGDGAGWEARRVAEAASWPLLAEPASGARSGPNALATYRLLLQELGPQVERVVVFGRPTLSRPVTRLLDRLDAELIVVARGNPWSDLRRPHAVTTSAVAPSWVTPGAARAVPDGWLGRWLDADRAACAAVAHVLGDEVSGPSLARLVSAAVPPQGLLVAGSSASIRDLDLAEPWDDPLPPDEPTGPGAGEHRLALANRGTAGIDGTVSTAVGAALAHQGGHGYALVGDLTFLHDGTGLVIGPDEPRPDLTIVVNNDDGGGIFTTLEQGAREHATPFERLFGTPHGVDLAAWCAATHTPYTLATSLDGLREALCPRAGISVVEVRTDRAGRRDLEQRLAAAVTAAIPR
jgi:2-succinyl-5-enolpyruvyl-6-hydroxy-3-cyclohexene-1-carboxylate synthase